MRNKIGMVVLSLFIICGGIYFFIHKQTVQHLTNQNKLQAVQIKELDDKLKKSNRKAEDLLRNLNDYLYTYDYLLKKTSIVLPALYYSTPEEHQALLFAKSFLRKNTYQDHSIIASDEIVTFLEALPTNKASIFTVSIHTYRPQLHHYALPNPSDVRLGSLMTIQVEKDPNGWKIIGEINRLK